MIRRFDVFRNPNAKSARVVPYLVLLQSELLDSLATQMVAPLVRATALGGIGAERLNPELVVEGNRVLLLPQQMGAVQATSLTKWVTNLDANRHEILAAVDFLFSGV